MENSKVSLAVQCLKNNQAFTVGDLRLGMNERNEMYVTGWSNFVDIKNLHKRLAKEELIELKTLFSKMVESSIDLRDFIKGKNIKCNLTFNYGTGSIVVCSEINGIVSWEVDALT